MFGCDKMKGSGRWFKRADIYLLAAIFMCVIMAFAFHFLLGRNDGAECVVIEQDGEVLYRIPFTKLRQITVEWQDEYNVIRIEEDGFSVIEADCPDLLCVQQGKVTEAGTSVICLPHRLVVYIDGDSENTVDALTD